jgi:hypothetical protein
LGGNFGSSSFSSAEFFENGKRGFQGATGKAQLFYIHFAVFMQIGIKRDFLRGLIFSLGALLMGFYMVHLSQLHR